MRYSPKIKLNEVDIKYTYGKQLMYKNGIEFIGYYHKYFDSLYSGKIHDSTSQLLINYNNDKNYINYIIINQNQIKYKTPIHTSPINIDYSKIFINRYFIKKRNDPNSKIIEIDELQYKSLGEPYIGIDNNYYYSIIINWMIYGILYDYYDINNRLKQEGVFNHNEREIIKYNSTMSGIDSYLFNKTEYSQIILNL